MGFNMSTAVIGEERMQYQNSECDIVNSLVNDLVMRISAVRDYFDVCIETFEELSTWYERYKKIKDIPTRLYMYKYKLFCQGIHDINKEDGEKYINKIGREKIKRESFILLEIINQIEEQEKVLYIAKIFKARVEGKLGDIEYRRMLVYVNKTLYLDLNYMIDNIANRDVLLNTIEYEELYRNGWLNLAPIGRQSINKESKILCSFNELAIKFCELVK